jgi:hypothetical protein
MSVIGPLNGVAGNTGLTGMTGMTGATGSYARQSINFNSNSIGAGVLDVQDIAFSKIANILAITTDYPAWIRIYGTSASRAADFSRLITQDPTYSTGVYLDVLTIGGSVLNLAPIAPYCNTDGTPANTAYVTIVNQDTVTRTVNTTISYLPLEI